MVPFWECSTAKVQPSCRTGSLNQEVKISGRMVRLDRLKHADLTVKTTYYSDESKSKWHRELTIDAGGKSVSFGASPGKDLHVSMETFIDNVLDALTERMIPAERQARQHDRTAG